MNKLAFSLVFLFVAAGCGGTQRAAKTTAANNAATAQDRPVTGIFSDGELKQFAALGPIDTHTHASVSDPAFYAMLKRLNLHIVDILVDDDSDPQQKNFSKLKEGVLNVVHSSDGYAVLCTTFDPFRFGQPDFASQAIQGINHDFAQGAIAVKIWKNFGMEIKDAKGNYVMPDNPALEPIFQDISARGKTLIAHLADPNTIWEAPTPSAPDYDYYSQHPKLYMYGKPNAPGKADILRARDRILARNPKLRVVGAHLGSMEVDFPGLADRLDKYPNFAVDMAARMEYVEMQPRASILAFITRYQDRLIYGTDNEFNPGQTGQDAVQDWETAYANDWRFLATDDTIPCPHCRNGSVKGLALPEPILRKLYHDNAVKWFPGVLGNSPAGAMKH